MDNLQKQIDYWDRLYSDEDLLYPLDDLPFMDRLYSLCSGKRVLDLGCGNGVVSCNLFKHNIHVVASDFSEEALKTLHSIEPKIEIVKFDMTKGFPFINNYFDIVVAELSLHYFNKRVTKRILAEITRILVPDGLLVVRVNSIAGNYPPVGAKRINKDFYLLDGITRSYYSVDSLRAMLSSNWSVIDIEEQETFKYRMKKPIIFCVAKSKEDR